MTISWNFNLFTDLYVGSPCGNKCHLPYPSRDLHLLYCKIMHPWLLILPWELLYNICWCFHLLSPIFRDILFAISGPDLRSQFTASLYPQLIEKLLCFSSLFPQCDKYYIVLGICTALITSISFTVYYNLYFKCSWNLLEMHMPILRNVALWHFQRYFITCSSNYPHLLNLQHRYFHW